MAQYADIWHSFGDLDTHREKAGILAARCADVGRSPNQIERSVPWRGTGNAAPLVEAGVTLFTVGVSGPDYDLTDLVEAIGWRDENSAPPLSGLA